MVEIQRATPGMSGALAAIEQKYDDALRFYESGPLRLVTPSGRLIPREDLASLIEALDAKLKPATKRQVAEALTIIAAAWPHGHQRAEQSVMDLHARMMAEDLSEFPADILFDVIRELRRTQRFVPAISEIYALASEARWRRRRRLELATEHLREHNRRDAEARAVARQEAERQRRQEERISRLATTYGAPFRDCSVDDIDAADMAFLFAGSPRLVIWLEACDNGELWASQAFPPMAAAGRVCDLMRKQRLRRTEASAIVSIAFSDLDRASRIIAAIAAGALPSELLGEDTTTLDDPCHILRDMVDRMRRGPPATGLSAAAA